MVKKLESKEQKEIFHEDIEPLVKEDEQVVNSEEEKPKKVDRRRRKRSPQEIEQLKKNLAIGRARSAETRKRNAKINKMKKLKVLEEEEKELLKTLSDKHKNQKEKDELISEMEKMKIELENLRNAKKPDPEPVPVKRADTPAPKVIERVESPDLFEDIDFSISKRPKKPIVKKVTEEPKKVETVAKPVSQPEPTFSMMDAYKMLKKKK